MQRAERLVCRKRRGGDASDCEARNGVRRAKYWDGFPGGTSETRCREPVQGEQGGEGTGVSGPEALKPTRLGRPERSHSRLKQEEGGGTPV